MAQARFEQIPLLPGQSFACREFKSERFASPWHYHPEYELTLILAGSGLRYVGDSVAPYRAGDLVFIGPNLPHYWWSGPVRQRSHSLVIQFPASFLEGGLAAWPEAESVRRMARRAGRALRFARGPAARAMTRLEQLPGLEGWDRLEALLAALGQLAELEAMPLASAGYAPDLDAQAGVRMAAACRYVHEHFAEDVRQPVAARRAALSPAAFSRYFHRHMGKTFAAYVNEVRIGQACRGLLESDLSVSEIAYQVGFNTLANFNRRFRKIAGVTPRAFRERP